jgi:hypothetical protein
MSRILEKTVKNWTYRDYCQWPDDERWELIDGVAYAKNHRHGNPGLRENPQKSALKPMFKSEPEA